MLTNQWEEEKKKGIWHKSVTRENNTWINIKLQNYKFQQRSKLTT